jgi:hypothetical protein
MQNRVAACCVMIVGFLAGTLVIPSGARGGFEIVSDSVKVDSINDQIIFKLLFSEPPDFLTLDTNGAPRHAFQYEIDGDWTWGQDSFAFDRIDSVVRGIEIHEEGDLRIRDTRPSSDPDAGGWGRILASVPIELQGNELTFTVQKSLIDDSNGKFQYRLFALENGEMTKLIEKTIVPLPTAVWSGLSLFGGLAAFGAVKRFGKRVI